MMQVSEKDYHITQSGTSWRRGGNVLHHTLPSGMVRNGFIEMMEDLNKKDGMFRFQFDLANALTIVVVALMIVPMWISQIRNDEDSRRSLMEHTETLKRMDDHLASIDKADQQALIDDDRLQTLRKDVDKMETDFQVYKERHP
jgi:hypothetical protein